MQDKLYIMLDADDGHLIVDGQLRLFRRLLTTLWAGERVWATEGGRQRKPGRAGSRPRSMAETTKAAGRERSPQEVRQ